MQKFLAKEELLFCVTYRGIPLWELFRYEAYNCINKRSYNLSSTQEKGRNFLFYLSSFFYLIKHCPFFYLGKKEVLIIRCSRKYNEGDSLVDPYTIDIEKSYPPQKIGIYESDRHISSDCTLPDQSLIEKATRLITRLIKYIPRQSRELDSKIEQITSVFPELNSSWVKQKYYNFIVSRFFYRIILYFRNPNVVYFTNYVDKMALIAACKEKNIKTAEVQHGFTSPESILYHFPYNKKGTLYLFPDEYNYLSEYMFYKVDIPLEREYIKQYDRTFINKKFEILKQNNKEKNSILFISQPILYHNIDFVEKFCYLLKKKNSDICIYYKCHASEYQLVDMEYIGQLKANYNFVFIDADSDIYDYISKVSLVAGVYSTALIEALEFECEVFVVKVDGYTLFCPFIEEGLMKLVETPQELVDQIN